VRHRLRFDIQNDRLPPPAQSLQYLNRLKGACPIQQTADMKADDHGSPQQDDAGPSDMDIMRGNAPDAVAASAQDAPTTDAKGEPEKDLDTRTGNPYPLHPIIFSELPAAMHLHPHADACSCNTAGTLAVRSGVMSCMTRRACRGGGVRPAGSGAAWRGAYTAGGLCHRAVGARI